MQPNLLEVEDLTKHFGALRAVDGISFSARAGEIFGLLGPNGAGKTTSLRLLGTTLRPTSGTARVAGFDVCRASREVRRNIGFLTASIGLYGRFTARENLEYFGLLYGMERGPLRERVDELIRLLDMKDFADRRAENFSTGMKQRVAIARAVVHDPPVIVLDEPTAGLDVLAGQIVEKFMLSCRDRQKCVVLSTHLMFEAEKLCDRVGILHKGKLVALESLKDLVARTGTTNLEDAFLHLVREEGAV